MEITRSILTTEARLGALCECVNIWELCPNHHRSCNKFHTVSSCCNCALGAALPASSTTRPQRACPRLPSRERCFDNASAGFASRWTLNTRKSPRWTRCCPTARCLTCPIPALLQIPTAAESVCTLRVVLKPKSRPTLWIPSASVVPLKVPPFCVELQCLI